MVIPGSDTASQTSTAPDQTQSALVANSAGSPLLATIQSSLDDDKAQDVTVIDLTGKSSVADFMVIASGSSGRQVAAMAEHVSEKVKAMGLTLSLEGKNNGDWVLIDAGDVVVHLFRPEVRSFYNIEKMWSASPKPAGPAN